ncbi:MAG: hypothetical protein B6D64_09750 [Bacteroidetes bacterium 4484_276]|jgi:hypothetical protein|nr:MAG: hypothetical protein B6D64_09750 [Bacteroidetes bacterium 4484_276]OQX96303.1 MAG: hypothetical protein B6I20_14600 [Bacteroidetes bacterium 4572_117]
MDSFEKHIASQLQDDQLNFSTDPAIYDRLMYHMQLKSSKSAVRKNQFLPSISVLFATKLISWKLGIAAILLISFMGYRQLNQNVIVTHVSDSARIVNTFDTTNILMKDSILKN